LIVIAANRAHWQVSKRFEHRRIADIAGMPLQLQLPMAVIGAEAKTANRDIMRPVAPVPIVPIAPPVGVPSEVRFASRKPETAGSRKYSS
jgi:hypothetical protein